MRCLWVSLYNGKLSVQATFFPREIQLLHNSCGAIRRYPSDRLTDVAYQSYQFDYRVSVFIASLKGGWLTTATRLPDAAPMGSLTQSNSPQQFTNYVL